MNVTFAFSYTNDVSPEYLRKLDAPCFSEQELAQFDEQSQANIRLQRTYIDAHPAVAIFRCAAEGSQTRDGGVIQKGTAPVSFELEDGQTVRGACKGDYVLYVDGSTVPIITGAGQGHNDLALVGSLLGNGDEIINTPQGGFSFVMRDGVLMADDFLPSIVESDGGEIQ